jgi:hypothetical protein
MSVLFRVIEYRRRARAVIIFWIMGILIYIPVMFVAGGSEAVALQGYPTCSRLIWTRKQTKMKQNEE